MNKDWVEKDYYAIIGVPSGASQDEIKRAYRKLAQQLHPDANPDNPSAEDKFKDVSEAYATLSNEDQRRQYDEVRQMVASGGFSGGFPSGAGFGGGGQRVRVEDIGDLIGGFGGLGDLFGGGGRRQAGPRRGADLSTDMTMSFRDAVQGATTTLKVRGQSSCSRCQGNGAEPGTSVQTCTTCGGMGTVSQNQGVFSFAQPCRTCQGRGRVISKPCTNCRGAGSEVRTRNISVKIPPGVNDAATIRLRGKGSPGQFGGPSGDLLVQAHVDPHPLFKRKGQNLTAKVPLSFTEAALGSEIEVPTLDGSVRLKIPAGTTTGNTFRVKERGIPKTKGKAGDLLVTVEVAVPKKLSRAAKKLLEQYRDEFETEDVRASLSG